MYIVIPCKVSKKSEVTLHELDGISFGIHNKIYKINNLDLLYQYIVKQKKIAS